MSPETWSLRPVKLAPPSPPTPVYKHVHNDYADAFLDGSSYQAGTLSSYREGEGDRVDPLEGIAVNESGNQTFSFGHGRQPTPGQDSFLRTFGTSIPENLVSNVFISMSENESRHHLRDQYIFCVSMEPDFSRTAKNERIFRIEDIDAFATSLARARPDILGRYLRGPVKYEPRQRIASPGDIVEAHPLRKSDRFSFEREFRVAFEPGVILKAREFVVSSSAALLVTEVRS